MTGHESERQPYRHENHYQEDEISLIDLLRVIWKWKWLIVAGVVLFIVAAAVISFQMPKVYEISMFIEPGIVGVKSDGSFIYIDSSESISGKINEGVYNREVEEALHLNSSKTAVKFKSTVIKNSNVTKVTSRWKEGNTDLGVKAAGKLFHFLSDNYRGIIEQGKGDYDKQIVSKQNEIRKLEEQKNSLRETLKNIKQIMDKLENEAGNVKNNTENLMGQRELLLKKGKDGVEMTFLLYTTTIQQNISYFTEINDQIYTFKEKEEAAQRDIKNFEKDINTLEAEIKLLTGGKDLISNIKIIQQPEVSPDPVAPKKMLIISLMGMVALFVFIFLAFFIEYIRNFQSLNKSGR